MAYSARDLEKVGIQIRLPRYLVNKINDFTHQNPFTTRSKSMRELLMLGLEHYYECNGGEKCMAKSARVFKADLMRQNLIEARMERKLSLATVAAKTGISVMFLSEMERGYKNPSETYRKKLVDFFGIEEETLFKQGFVPKGEKQC
jgi:DNA-binding XRE family transcriptional regulator